MLNSVLVMNNFTLCKRSPEHARHHKNMFKNRLRFRGIRMINIAQQHVSRLAQLLSAFPVTVALFKVALTAALGLCMSKTVALHHLLATTLATAKPKCCMVVFVLFLVHALDHGQASKLFSSKVLKPTSLASAGFGLSASKTPFENDLTLAALAFANPMSRSIRFADHCPLTELRVLQRHGTPLNDDMIYVSDSSRFPQNLFRKG